MKRKSQKSYGVAVSLSAVFGVLGVQHFYLGRHWEGFFDFFLTAGWFYFLVTEQPLLFLLFLGADLLHTFITTIMLITGSFKDSEGAYVCYPGQKLNERSGNL